MNTTLDGRKYDPNDYKVVEFHNSQDFDFTPELGAMYDGRPLFVGKGERRQFPYHIGNRLAENLAKAVMIKGAPPHNPEDRNPTGAALWNDEKLGKLKASFMTELYSDETPIAQSQTELLMAKVAELERLVKKDEAHEISAKIDAESAEVAPAESTPEPPKTYRDKQEVIKELEARGITHDKRKGKDELEQLLK